MSLSVDIEIVEVLTSRAKTSNKINKPYDEVLGAAQLIKHVKACKGA